MSWLLVIQNIIDKRARSGPRAHKVYIALASSNSARRSGERGGGGEKAKTEKQWKREREKDAREDGREGDIPTSKLLSGI